MIEKISPVFRKSSQNICEAKNAKISTLELNSKGPNHFQGTTFETQKYLPTNHILKLLNYMKM
jgi:hypothetical protein